MVGALPAMVRSQGRKVIASRVTTTTMTQFQIQTLPPQSMVSIGDTVSRGVILEKSILLNWWRFSWMHSPMKRNDSCDCLWKTTGSQPWQFKWFKCCPSLIDKNHSSKTTVWIFCGACRSQHYFWNVRWPEKAVSKARIIWETTSQGWPDCI